MLKRSKIKQSEQLIDFLTANFDLFTPTQKSLANYLLENLDEAAFLTADELADKVDTTSSSIVRFAQEIGFKGFPDLQDNLRKILIKKVSTIGPSQQAKKFKSHEKENAITASLIKDVTNLNKLYEMKNESQIRKFAELFISGQKKYIIASRSLYSMGHFFFFHIKQIIPEVFFLHNFDGGLFDTIPELSDNDVLVALSFPRYNRATIDYVKSAKERGTKIISITDSRISPLYNLSALCLFCPYESSAFFTSSVATLALLNAIISEVFYRNFDSAIQSLEKKESILLQRNILVGKRLKFNKSF